MNQASLLRIKQLFLQVSDLSAAERAAVLDAQEDLGPELRSRIDALLARHDAEEQLASPALGRFEERDPEALGRYRILRRIGEGGMGVVYLAEQSEPVVRTVAVKRIKAGMDSEAMLRRFEAERHALERMDHPAIARVLDAGIDRDGRPFFAMEYVDGVSLIQFCDRERLDPEARLQLFVDVCRGVQHAHQKGVLHRDLKPSNVLVTEVDGKPVPKIIDFGVAKTLERQLAEQTAQTRLGVMIGTPEYMSPEQAEPGAADVDTRSDVYSLGVMLYELLSGDLPFSPSYLREQGFAGIQRVLQHEEPPRPSTRVSTISEHTNEQARRRRLPRQALAHRLRGDLDWITMRALHKRREQRYGSAGEFAADIERHLRNEPVLAGPPSLAYRVQKFVRRYRAQAVTVAVGVVTLLLGTGVSVWFAIDARTLLRQLEESQQNVLRERRAVEGVLDRATVRMEQHADSSSVAAADARAQAVIGEAYSALGRQDDAVQSFRRALEQLEASPQPSAQETYSLLRSSLLAHMTVAGFGERGGWMEKLRQAGRAVLSEGEPELAAALQALELLVATDPGVEAFGRVLAVAEQRFEADDRRWIPLADILALAIGFTADRVGTAEQVLAIYARQGLPASDVVWLRARFGAVALCNMPFVARFDDAHRLARQALDDLSQELPSGHWFLGLLRCHLGCALLRLGQREQAERELYKSLEVIANALGSDAPQLGFARLLLVECLEEQGKIVEAEELRLKLADRLRRSPGSIGIHFVEGVLRPQFAALADAVTELVPCCGEPAAALPRIDQILARSRASFPDYGVRAAVVTKFLFAVGNDVSNAGAHSAPMRRLFEYVDEVLTATASARSYELWWLARHCYLLGDFAAGERAAVRALSPEMAITDPAEIANLRSLLGLCRFELGGGSEALELALSGYHGLVATIGLTNGNADEAFGFLMAAFRRDGQGARIRQLAEQRLQQLVLASAGAQSVWMLADDALAGLGDDGVATEAVVELERRFPEDFRSRCGRAMLAAIGFEGESARTSAKQALLGTPESWVCQNAIADVYCRLGMAAEANACGERAIALRNTPAIRNGHAVRMLRLGDLVRAQELCVQLAADYPDYARAHANLASCLRALGDLDGALAAAQRAFDLEPEAASSELARVRLARGEEATELFARQSERVGRPNGSGFWPDYAMAMARAGRLEEAKQRLQRLTADWPTEPHAWSARAWALCSTTGVTDNDRRAALGCAQKAVALSNRQGPVMLASLAEAHFRLGDSKAASTIMDECLLAMHGRHAEWLTLSESELRRSRYSGR